MLRLQTKVELPQQHAPTFLGDPDPVAPLAPAGVALHGRRHLLQDLQVESEQLLQTRTLHLEDHLSAAAQAGAMHLGQAG